MINAKLTALYIGHHLHFACRIERTEPVTTGWVRRVLPVVTGALGRPDHLDFFQVSCEDYVDILYYTQRAEYNEAAPRRQPASFKHKFTPTQTGMLGQCYLPAQGRRLAMSAFQTCSDLRGSKHLCKLFNQGSCCYSSPPSPHHHHPRDSL